MKGKESLLFFIILPIEEVSPFLDSQGGMREAILIPCRGKKKTCASLAGSHSWSPAKGTTQVCRHPPHPLSGMCSNILPRTRATGLSMLFCHSRYLNSLTEPLISSKRNLKPPPQNANEKPVFPESIFFQKLTDRAAPEPTGSHYSCEFIRGENCLTAKMLQGVPRLRLVPKCQTQCASVCHLPHFP